MSFPKGFMIGSATAAHQVEGNNIYSDYWAMEHMKYTSFVEPSGDACDHYNRYEDDIRMLAEAGLNAYRFSIEWARIEPEKGQFDEKEIEHYRSVIRCCRKYGVTPIVTMMHFTSPVWLIREGGWEAESTVEYFRRYCAYVAEKLGDEMEYIVTINEANMGLQVGALMKRFMKQMMAAKAAAANAGGSGASDAGAKEGAVQVGLNLDSLMERQKLAAAENMEIFGTPQPKTFVSGLSEEGDRLIMRAHQAARDAMKEKCPHLKIGLSLSVHDIQAVPGGEQNAAAEWDEEFSHYIPYIQNDDFFGLQNYTRSRYDAEGVMATPEGAELTQMDYEYYPEALEHVIRRVHAELPIDIIITENGVGIADDERRCAFIRTAMEGVQNCLADGIPVKGYMHWSLMDNFEWQKGFSMTFGLIAVDRSTQKRTPKPSLALLGSYAKQIG
ncbi:MAG: family 1 glycosylhydrolase [Lachnospiraceae bacterium]|nr:family 1 glycosylhydrolase [Lachnospiraceae bacterium]